MNFRKQNLGIDIDAKLLKVSFQWIDIDQQIKIKASRTFANTQEGFEELVKWSTEKKKSGHAVHVTMEATGVYYEKLAYFLFEHKDYVVHVLLPNKTKAYIKSLNIKTKTDEVEAKALGRLGLERKLPPWRPGSTQMRSLKKLVRERLRLQTEKTLVINQLHAEQHSHMPFASSIRRYEARIAFLTQQIATIEAEIKAFVLKDEQLKARIDQVCTAPGLGFITVVGVLAETDGFALVKNRSQLVSYSGYDVVENQSGTSLRGKTKISKKGNANIRRILYMPAFTAVKYDDHHKNYYNRVFDKTKIKMKGYVAIQRKLLVLIYALYKGNVPYDPEYNNKVKRRLNSTHNRLKTEKEARKKQKFADWYDKKIGRQETSPAYSG